MKAYKVFRIVNDRLMSAIVENSARIKYCLGQPNLGKLFMTQDGKMVRLPVIAFQTLEAVKEFQKSCLENRSYPFEVWEVEGEPCRQAIRYGNLNELEYGRYSPTKNDFPEGTVFLENCKLLQKVDD